MITHFQKNLFCLIVALPFYHIQATDPQKPLAAEWTFTIKRTSSGNSPEWLALITRYATAAQKLLSKETLEEIKKELHGLPLSEFNEPQPEIDETILQPFLGQRLATFLTQVSRDNGIHGDLAVSLDQTEVSEATEITWKLELTTNEDFSATALSELTQELHALTHELNENTIAPDDQNYGSLLHDVTKQARAGAPYTCHASLTLHT